MKRPKPVLPISDTERKIVAATTAQHAPSTTTAFVSAGTAIARTNASAAASTL